jgi:hypothetical protein
LGSPLKLIHALEILQSQEQGQVGFEDGCWSCVLGFCCKRMMRETKKEKRQEKKSKSKNNILMIENNILII